MSPEAETLLRIFESERNAARSLDFDALLRLQDEKRACVARFRESNPAPHEAELIIERCRSNLALLGQMVRSLEGFARVGEAPVYSATGARSTSIAPIGQSRGQL